MNLASVGIFVLDSHYNQQACLHTYFKPLIKIPNIRLYRTLKIGHVPVSPSMKGRKRFKNAAHEDQTRPSISSTIHVLIQDLINALLLTLACSLDDFSLQLDS
jgi:hypothetical protein